MVLNMGCKAVLVLSVLLLVKVTLLRLMDILVVDLFRNPLHADVGYAAPARVSSPSAFIYASA